MYDGSILRNDLRILTGKKCPQIRLQRLEKVSMWTFKSLPIKSTLYKRFLN